jgi:hypothetical protein
MILNNVPDTDLDPVALRFVLWCEAHTAIQRIASAETDEERNEWQTKLAVARARFDALCAEPVLS